MPCEYTIAVTLGHTRKKNAANALLALSMLIPMIGSGYWSNIYCKPSSNNVADLFSRENWDDIPDSLCRIGHQYPLFHMNIMFFTLVCVLFWLISLIQRSTWLIDLYWTILPPLIGVYYRTHPQCTYRGYRSTVILFLLFAWSIRLTHSYFRREEWNFGAREDWRFGNMRKKWPKSFWLSSLFLAYISQWPMLVGITLPVYAVHFPPESDQDKNFDLIDSFLTVASIVSLAIAYVSDTQLYRFMESNKRLKIEGKATEMILRDGLWKYSRHPNYFGEQLWWWCMALFGCRIGASWTALGQLFNCLCMLHVTELTEQRMLTGERASLYREYMLCTSKWIPLLPAKSLKKFR